LSERASGRISSDVGGCLAETEKKSGKGDDGRAKTDV